MKHSYVEFLINQATNAVIAEIENKVVKILRNKKNAGIGFINGMGTYFFIDKENNLINDDRKWMEPIQDLYHRYDDTLKISGVAVRWDLDQVSGKVIRRDKW